MHKDTDSILSEANKAAPEAEFSSFLPQLFFFSAGLTAFFNRFFNPTYSFIVNLHAPFSWSNSLCKLVEDARKQQASNQPLVV